MGATHRIEVLTQDGPVIRVKVTTVHPDEHTVPLKKTKVLSMLYGALWEVDEVAPQVKEAYEAAGGDEPEDGRSASTVLRSVELRQVLAGDVRKQNRNIVVFAEGGAVELCLTLRNAALGQHLLPGLAWETAPLGD